MGLAISSQLNGYEAVSQLELGHLALSDLETRSDGQSGAAPASGGGTTWSRKVQVGRIFGAAPHHPKLSDAQHHGRKRFMCPLLVLGVLVVCKEYFLPDHYYSCIMQPAVCSLQIISRTDYDLVERGAVVDDYDGT